MNIDDIKAAGGFTSEQGEKRAIEWSGHKGEVFVRQVSFGRIVATQALPDAERNIALVRECIRLGDSGEVQLSREQVEALNPALASAFMTAIAEVNALGEAATDPKN